jgi:hypothetical protein
MFCGDCYVVDVDFPSLSFEFPELVGREPADHRIVLHRCQRNEVIAANQVFEIRGAGLRTRVRVRFLESLAEDGRRMSKGMARDIATHVAVGFGG